MLTVVDVVTPVVVMLNFCEVWRPAWIRTEAGTAATPGFELDSVTVVPADGAGAFNCTSFEVTETPPFTVLAESLTAYGVPGLRVRGADAVTEL